MPFNSVFDGQPLSVKTPVLIPLDNVSFGMAGREEGTFRSRPIRGHFTS